MQITVERDSRATGEGGGEEPHSLEDGEDGSNVAGEALGLTEEHNERVVGGEEVFEGIHIPLYSLTVPREYCKILCLRRVVGR